MGEYKKEAGDAKKENIDPSGRWQHYVFDLLTDLPRIHELGATQCSDVFLVRRSMCVCH